MELDMIGIGERIKTRRKELKLSQTDIYERCDITSGALSKIENGKTTPSVIAFYKLSQVLECDMNWLATGISSNMQKSNICKLEEELLNGFRELPEDETHNLKWLYESNIRCPYIDTWKHAKYQGMATPIPRKHKKYVDILEKAVDTVIENHSVEKIDM